MREHHTKFAGCEVTRYEDGDSNWTLEDASEFLSTLDAHELTRIVLDRRIHDRWRNGDLGDAQALAYSKIKEGELLPDWLEVWLTGYFDEETREDEWGVVLAPCEFSEPDAEVDRLEAQR